MSENFSLFNRQEMGKFTDNLTADATGVADLTENATSGLGKSFSPITQGIGVATKFIDPEGKSMLGGLVGGGASGAALGAKIGGGPTGAAIGAVLGGISGIFGASNKQKQAEAKQKAEVALAGARQQMNTAQQLQNMNFSFSGAQNRNLKF